jgi:hypothetical protein
MRRLALVNRGPLLTTPGLSSTLDALEEVASKYDLSVELKPPDGLRDLPTPLSLAAAGRELRIKLHGLDQDPYRVVASLWSLSVPLGFTPLQRHPLPGEEDDVFHFLGPWQPLYDRLCSEGRGELAWPSVCCAAQCDVGRWEGDRKTERFVQAQLSRLGEHCGAIDGKVGNRTIEAMRRLGIGDLSLDEAARHLVSRDPEERAKGLATTVGHLVCPGRQLSVSVHGDVSSVRTRDGCSFSVHGEGTAIIMFGKEVER